MKRSRLRYLILFIFSIHFCNGQQRLLFTAIGTYRNINNAAAFGPGISAAFDLPISKKASIQSGIGFYYLQNRVDYPVDSSIIPAQLFNGSNRRLYYSRVQEADLILPFSISYRIWTQKKSQLRIAPGLLFGLYLIDRGEADYYLPPTQTDSIFRPGPFHMSSNQLYYTNFREEIFMRFSLSAEYLYQFSKKTVAIAGITVHHLPDEALKPTWRLHLGVGIGL
mgnify:CR=1 FL=1